MCSNIYSVPFAERMAKTQLHKLRVLSGGHPLPRTVLNSARRSLDQTS